MIRPWRQSGRLLPKVTVWRQGQPGQQRSSCCPTHSATCLQEGGSTGAGAWWAGCSRSRPLSHSGTRPCQSHLQGDSHTIPTCPPSPAPLSLCKVPLLSPLSVIPLRGVNPSVVPHGQVHTPEWGQPGSMWLQPHLPLQPAWPLPTSSPHFHPQGDLTCPKVNLFRHQCPGVCTLVCQPCPSGSQAACNWLRNPPSVVPGEELGSRTPLSRCPSARTTRNTPLQSFTSENPELYLISKH